MHEDAAAAIDRVSEHDALRLLVMLNVAGAVYGAYHYVHFISHLPQVQARLAALPLPLWVMVPDSAFAVALAALSFGLHLRGRGNTVVDAMAVIGNMKYGAWSFLVLMTQREAFLAGVGPFLVAYLAMSHLFMVAQAGLILRIGRLSAAGVVAAGAWYAVNDIVDYTFMVQTPVPRPGEPLVMLAAVTLTAAAWLVTVGAYRSRG